MGKFADFILIQFMVFLAVFTGCALAKLALSVCIVAGILSAIAAGMPWIAVSKRDKKEGFIKTGRSEKDEQGRDFPLLHLELLEYQEKA